MVRPRGTHTQILWLLNRTNCACAHHAIDCKRKNNYDDDDDDEKIKSKNIVCM